MIIFIQVTSGGQVIQHKQLLKQERSVMVTSKMASTTMVTSSSPAKKPKKDKYDLDSLVARNEALCYSEDELENVSDYDNFTESNLEMSSGDESVATEMGKDYEMKQDVRACDLEAAASLAPEIAHQLREMELKQSGQSAEPQSLPPTHPSGLKPDWGEVKLKPKGPPPESPDKERRRSIKEVAAMFESKMSPFS